MTLGRNDQNTGLQSSKPTRASDPGKAGRGEKTAFDQYMKKL